VIDQNRYNNDSNRKGASVGSPHEIMSGQVSLDDRAPARNVVVDISPEIVAEAELIVSELDFSTAALTSAAS